MGAEYSEAEFAEQARNLAAPIRRRLLPMERLTCLDFRGMRILWATLPDDTKKRFIEGTGGEELDYRELHDGTWEVFGYTTTPEVRGDDRILKVAGRREKSLGQLPEGTTFEWR